MKKAHYLLLLICLASFISLRKKDLKSDLAHPNTVQPGDRDMPKVDFINEELPATFRLAPTKDRSVGGVEQFNGFRANVG